MLDARYWMLDEIKYPASSIQHLSLRYQDIATIALHG
jgi:hypothetical protein